MTAADPLAYLFALEPLGMKFGLENITTICERLEHPERSFQSVLVGGTNGKGSVTAMVEAALRAGGHHTARYTSPHLERLEERFMIDGAEATTTALREAAGRVQHTVETLLTERVLAAPPTFFEFTTATAFELFRQRAAGIAVLEVGLGGRLDATNVVTPLCAAITSIGLDHQAQLGDTLESIAWEKAGIVKPGIPLVCGPLPAIADAVIAGVCEERDAPLRRTTEHARIEIHQPVAPPIASFRTKARDLREVTLALDGRHQIDNAAVAVCILDALAEAGLEVDDAAARTGLSTTNWPARIERLHWRGAEILLDAAHNPAGTSALSAYLNAIGWRDVTLVFGVMSDKDVRGMLRTLLPACTRVVFTTPPTPRALPAADVLTLASVIDGLPPASVVPDPAAAIADAAASGGRVVVAGSLFLIGALRGILR